MEETQELVKTGLKLAITMDNLWSVTQFLDLRPFSKPESHVWRGNWVPSWKRSAKQQQANIVTTPPEVPPKTCDHWLEEPSAAGRVQHHLFSSLPSLTEGDGHLGLVSVWVSTVDETVSCTAAPAAGSLKDKGNGRVQSSGHTPARLTGWRQGRAKLGSIICSDSGPVLRTGWNPGEEAGGWTLVCSRCEGL